MVFDDRVYTRFSVRGYAKKPDTTKRAEKMRAGGRYYARVHEIRETGLTHIMYMLQIVRDTHMDTKSRVHSEVKDGKEMDS